MQGLNSTREFSTKNYYFSMHILFTTIYLLQEQELNAIQTSPFSTSWPQVATSPAPPLSLRTVPYRVTSQHERKSCSRLVRYASNALRPSSVKVLKVGLNMLPLSRLDPLWPEFPPFMFDVLEVVDSSTKSPKCVAT
jgi:hypothetical protein